MLMRESFNAHTTNNYLLQTHAAVLINYLIIYQTALPYCKLPTAHCQLFYFNNPFWILKKNIIFT